MKLPLLMLALSIIMTESLVESRKQKRKPEDIRPGRHDDVDRFDEVYIIVRNTFLLSIAPAVISFLYGVYRDPDLPFLMMVLWDATKRKVLGLLSNSNSHEQNYVREGNKRNRVIV
jgi:hypothetical protein